jgi:urease accessory protein
MGPLVGSAADDGAMLATLQLADSAFPSGAYVLSHGLETMVADGLLPDPSAIGRCLRAALVGRAGPGDLAALLIVHRAANATDDAPPDTARIIAADRRLAATKLAEEDRVGSVRVGRRIAVEAARLLGPSAVVSWLLETIDARETPGTMAVAFGAAAADLGIPARQAALSAASSFSTAFLAAAVRLGQIGHGDVQRLLRDARPAIVAAVEIATVAANAWDGGALRPFAPGLDIAVARHETAVGRLFAS